MKKHLLLLTALVAASASAAAKESFMINNNCNVVQIDGSTTYVYPVHRFNRIVVSPNNGRYNIRADHDMSHGNPAMVADEPVVRKLVDRYNACSGMALDPKAFPE